MEFKKKQDGAGGGPTGDLLTDIRQKTAPERVKQAVAKGLIPLDPNVLGEALLILSSDPDTEISSRAKKTLSGLPESILHYIAENQSITYDLLDTMAHLFSEDTGILEKIALNQSSSNETIDYIATLGSERVLNIIAGNQARMITYPKIMQSLLNNTHTPHDIKIRLQIYKKELIEQGVLKKIGTEMVSSPKTEAELDEFEAEDWEEEDWEEEEEEEEEEDLDEDEFEDEWERETYEEAVEEVEDKTTEDDHLSKAQQISKMTVAEKLVLARHAGKEERSILIRDPNKQVALNVLKSPKLTEGEAEMIARMRNVPEEVLREIANNRDWVKNSAIMLALTNNPKTPIAISLKFINRLQNRDLRDLSNNRNVSETIRTSAKRMLTQRQRQTGGKKAH